MKEAGLHCNKGWGHGLKEAELPRSRGWGQNLKEVWLPHSRGRGQCLKGAWLPHSRGRGHGSMAQDCSSSAQVVVRQQSVCPHVYTESQPDTGPRSNGTTSPCCTAVAYSRESWINDD